MGGAPWARGVLFIDTLGSVDGVWNLMLTGLPGLRLVARDGEDYSLLALLCLLLSVLGGGCSGLCSSRWWLWLGLR